MLVLTRKSQERIVISDRIVVHVLELTGGRVRLGFDAPPDVSIRREELPAAFEPEREWCGPVRKSR